MTLNPSTNAAPETNVLRNRLIKSLAAAVLIASLGFALIFLFFGSLPWFTFRWLSTLPPDKASSALAMMSIFARVFAFFTVLFTSLVFALLARRRAATSRSILPNRSRKGSAFKRP